MGIFVPILVGLLVLVVCGITPLVVPKSEYRQLLVVNIPISLTCFYMMWAMAYLSQLHLFQLPEPIPLDRIHHP